MKLRKRKRGKKYGIYHPTTKSAKRKTRDAQDVFHVAKVRVVQACASGARVVRQAQTNAFGALFPDIFLAI